MAGGNRCDSDGLACVLRRLESLRPVLAGPRGESTALGCVRHGEVFGRAYAVREPGGESGRGPLIERRIEMPFIEWFYDWCEGLIPFISIGDEG